MTAKLLFIIAKPPPFYNPVSAAEKDVSAARRGVHWLPRARGKRVCAAGGGKSKFAFSAAAPLAGRREAGPGMAFAARRARAVAKRLMRSPCSSAWSASKKTSSGPLGHLPRARGRQSGAARARGRHSGEACKTRGEQAGKGPRLTARQRAYTSPPGFPGRKQRLSCLSVHGRSPPCCQDIIAVSIQIIAERGGECKQISGRSVSGAGRIRLRFRHTAQIAR